MSPKNILQWLSSRNGKRLVFLTIPAAAAISFIAASQSTPPSIPAISLAAEPLYAKGTSDKPTLTLALSVEFPTVGAQYTKPGSSTSDDSYAPTNDYIGYFNSESCYIYNNAPTETPASGLTSTDYKRFERSSAATNRACGGAAFSGNFMNWATSSAIDILRLGLTGGDRIIDTSDITILQRAIILTSMFNDSYFPSKVLPSAYVADAVPSTLKGTHNGNIYVANCLNRVHFGTQVTGSCGAPGNNGNLGVTGGTAGTTALATTQNYFFTRVKVCDTDGSGALLDTRKFNDEFYCLKYPNGKYKPVGNLQKYSDRLRISVFGYLNQSGTARYGGVLRAPMKYVGPKYYDVNGSLVSGVNPRLEWSENSGVFVKDPEGYATATPEGISGAINYLNQFGRTGTTPGTYKTNDPVGELYYEALRYLQGLPPTSGTSISTSPTYGMTAADKDGFPVYSSWTDPHTGGDKTKDYTCLKNNLLTIADIGTHADKYIPGNSRTGNDDLARTYNIAENEPDFINWTKIVGAFEANQTLNYTHVVSGTPTVFSTINPNSSTGNYKLYTSLYNSASDNAGTQNTGAGSAAYYMAGMAYWAKNHDIRGTDWTGTSSGTNNEKQRPGMRVTTYTIDVNQNASSSAVDTRRKSQLFLAAKYGGFNDASGKGNPYYTKNVSGALIASNAVWDKSDINSFNPTEAGEARTHYLSSSAKGLLATLGNIFENIAREGNSIAGGAISTQRLTTTGGFVYQAQFDPADWSGDLVSQYVRVDASDVVTFSSGSAADPHQWYAGAKLDATIAANPDTSTRNIVVGKTTASTTATATNFNWTEIDADLQTALQKATPSLASDGLGESRLNFIRGSRALEGTTFRKRGSILGDIINSGVAFSGAPSTKISAANYQAFYTANKDRTKALFVGANDGMLHAFNSANGNEIFAYIPSWLGPKLPALTNTTYNTGNHQSFVDGSPAISEAEIGTDWKTVLVSGTGGGGQGVFALDITNPDQFSSSKVMWEFTDRDDADMGNVVGRPQILKFRTSSPGSTAVYKWFAAIPSGVNNYVNDGYFSTTGKPAIFLLDLSKPANAAWTLGSNYFKISLPISSTLSATKPTGLPNMRVTGGPSGEVATIFAGDLQGNLWKMNFLPWGSDDWNIEKLSPFQSTSATPTPIPFYIAKDDTGDIQPITMEPTITRGPGGGTVIAFGTGKYMEATDNIVNVSTQVQSFYALLDNNLISADASSPSSIISGKGRLKAGSISSTGVISVPSFVWGRATSDADTTQRSGWYFNYPSSGEKQISSLSIFGKTVIFGSIIPPNAVTDPCGSGNGFVYSVNLATGSGLRELSQVGLLGEPFVTEIGSLQVSISDSTGRRTRTAKGQIILQGSEGLQAISTQPTDISTVGRLSWRQINNYQDLKSAP